MVFGGAAALGLALAPVAAHALGGERVLIVAACGDHAPIRIPLGGKDPPASPDNPSGCHAACLRKGPGSEDLSTD